MNTFKQIGLAVVLLCAAFPAIEGRSCRSCTKVKRRVVKSVAKKCAQHQIAHCQQCASKKSCTSCG